MCTRFTKSTVSLSNNVQQFHKSVESIEFHDHSRVLALAHLTSTNHFEYLLRSTKVTECDEKTQSCAAISVDCLFLLLRWNNCNSRDLGKLNLTIKQM